MNTVVLSNILARIAPSNDGFSIYGSVNNESEFDTGVGFNDPTQRPAWTAVKAAETDEQWIEVRASRNFRLAQSDWVMNSDVPMPAAKRTEYEVYRQQLRDITEQADPYSISWPTAP